MEGIVECMIHLLGKRRKDALLQIKFGDATCRWFLPSESCMCRRCCALAATSLTYLYVEQREHDSIQRSAALAGAGELARMKSAVPNISEIIRGRVRQGE